MKARKKDTPAGGRKNYFLETLLFLAVMVLTLRFCFSGQKPQEIWAAVKSMRGMSLAGAVALGLFFVCMEGTIIRIFRSVSSGSVFESGDHACRDWNDCPAAMDDCLGGYF